MKQTILVNTKLNDHQIIPSLVIIQKKPYFSHLFHYYLLTLNKTYSTESLRMIARYLQTLFEFYLTYPPKTTQDKRKFLENYAYNLKNQKVLNWNNYSTQTMLYILLRIRDFTFWISKHQTLANKQELEFSQTIKESYMFLSQLNNTIFLSPLTNKEYQIFKRPEKIHKSFPSNKIITLINSFENPMYKILIIFLSFGGRRLHELLNIFIADITVEEKLKVIIAHPELSMIGKKTRTEYLHKFNRIPRTQMTGLNHVGFISSNFDNPKEMISEIHFIGSIDQYLISLHMQYMKHRKQFKHHPYYFINESGNPLTLTSVINVIKRKCKRLGLESVAEGISTQGLKHFYGYYSSHVLKLDKIIVQKLMGYAEISAVEKYHTNYNNVFKEIDKQKRIKHE